MTSQMADARTIGKRIIDNVERVIVGKRREVELAVIALISQGHFLIEDVPGMGKTMLARSIARSVGCTFKRIQFTPDVLPSDITGVSVYNQKTGDFEFRPGPVMAQMVLADEINRASPKTQSALLECMEEKQVTVDGITYKVPQPFTIMATQNTIEYEGIFPLPEAQLDRFLMRISLGYTTFDEEVAIIERQRYVHPIEKLEPVASASELQGIQQVVKEVHAEDAVKKFIVSLVDATRHHHAVYLGSSPRGSVALFRTAQARALLDGRDFVLPDDVKALAEAVLAHRVIMTPSTQREGTTDKSVVNDILESLAVPGALPHLQS